MILAHHLRLRCKRVVSCTSLCIPWQAYLLGPVKQVEQRAVSPVANKLCLPSAYQRKALAALHLRLARGMLCAKVQLETGQTRRNTSHLGLWAFAVKKGKHAS